mmetsp:Transcript_48732/g.150477  ORF Transcript_48732/g.150477 Transcript_48732/m.150477 type:complete len:508 (-) Transcript_48732:189-1712(-)
MCRAAHTLEHKLGVGRHLLHRHDDAGAAGVVEAERDEFRVREQDEFLFVRRRRIRGDVVGFRDVDLEDGPAGTTEAARNVGVPRHARHRGPVDLLALLLVLALHYLPPVLADAAVELHAADLAQLPEGLAEVVQERAQRLHRLRLAHAQHLVQLEVEVVGAVFEVGFGSEVEGVQGNRERLVIGQKRGLRGLREAVLRDSKRPFDDVVHLRDNGQHRPQRLERLDQRRARRRLVACLELHGRQRLGVLDVLVRRARDADVERRCRVRGCLRSGFRKRLRRQRSVDRREPRRNAPRQGAIGVLDLHGAVVVARRDAPAEAHHRLVKHEPRARGTRAGYVLRVLGKGHRVAHRWAARRRPEPGGLPGGGKANGEAAPRGLVRRGVVLPHRQEHFVVTAHDENAARERAHVQRAASRHGGRVRRAAVVVVVEHHHVERGALRVDGHGELDEAVAAGHEDEALVGVAATLGVVALGAQVKVGAFGAVVHVAAERAALGAHVTPVADEARGE